jgi:hypothetical protein
MVRSALVAQAWTTAIWVGLGAGAVIGLGTGRLVAARLRFHAADGTLAADAIRSASRRRYLLVWHALGIAALAVLTLLARPSILTVTLPGYLVGAVAGQLIQRLDLANIRIGGMRPGRTIRTIRAGAHQPAAGLTAAAVLLLALALPVLRENALGAVAGIVTAVLMLALTSIDHHVVDFMRLAGHGPWRILYAHARAAALFAGIAVPICWFGFAPFVAGTVAAVSVGALVLFAIRLLAYQIYGKRFAELAFSLLAGLLVLTAFALPPALPVMAAAMLWALHRRARARVWLLA